jgi:hypothetical protein
MKHLRALIVLTTVLMFLQQGCYTRPTGDRAQRLLGAASSLGNGSVSNSTTRGLCVRSASSIRRMRWTD